MYSASYHHVCAQYHWCALRSAQRVAIALTTHHAGVGVVATMQQQKSRRRSTAGARWCMKGTSTYSKEQGVGVLVLLRSSTVQQQQYVVRTGVHTNNTSGTRSCAGRYRSIRQPPTGSAYSAQRATVNDTVYSTCTVAVDMQSYSTVFRYFYHYCNALLTCTSITIIAFWY